jgi:flagellar operon protein
MGGLSGITGGAQPTSARGNGASGAVSGADFKNALDQFSQVGKAGLSQGGAGATAAAGISQLKFSAHAIERMKSRGIHFSPETMKNIEAAVGKAAQKGSKDTLVLTGDSALIVSVKNATVVTVMDKNAMKDNVFTNIDSTVMV